MDLYDIKTSPQYTPVLSEVLKLFKIVMRIEFLFEILYQVPTSYNLDAYRSSPLHKRLGKFQEDWTVCSVRRFVDPRDAWIYSGRDVQFQLQPWNVIRARQPIFGFKVNGHSLKQLTY
jgi:hypothetical protein